MSTQVAGLRRFAARAKTDRWEPPAYPIFVVAGAKGGCGTSTVTALLALAAAADGRRSLIVDADDGAGTHHRMLGLTPLAGFASLRDTSVDITNAMLDVTPMMMLLPGGCGAATTDGGPLSTTERRAIVRRVSAIYGEFDAIFIDAGTRLDGVIAAAERGAWRFLAVTGVEPVSLASAYAMVKALEVRWPGAPVDLLVNGSDETKGRAAFEQVRAGAQHFLGRTIEFAGTIPSDPALTDAALAERPLQALSTDHTAATTAVTDIAIRLTAEYDDSRTR
jgi:flagellar biosynthesis protein FlhG